MRADGASVSSANLLWSNVPGLISCSACAPTSSDPPRLLPSGSAAPFSRSRESGLGVASSEAVGRANLSGGVRGCAVGPTGWMLPVLFREEREAEAGPPLFGGRRSLTWALRVSSQPCGCTSLVAEIQSPREHRAARCRQRRWVATDSTAEQSLEVGASLKACREFVATRANGAAESEADGERAQAAVAQAEANANAAATLQAREVQVAVTQYGCSRGKRSEG